jgi:hypothetical protein
MIPPYKYIVRNVTYGPDWISFDSTIWCCGCRDIFSKKITVRTLDDIITLTCTDPLCNIVMKFTPKDLRIENKQKDINN